MIPFLRDKIIVNHSIKEIKRTKEYRVELAKFNVSKHMIFEEFSNINPQNISVKEDLIESINLIKQSHYIKAKSLLDGLEANFIEKNTLEYGIYLKYLANTYYHHGMINKAASFSVKSIEILQFHLSEFNALLIETKLEYNEIRNQLTNNFQNLKNSILKCLINSIIINDKKMIVYSYMCLGHAYKVYGQLHKSGFYCKLSHKLFKKYKLKDDNFELKVLLYILKTNSNYNTFSKLYMKGKFKKLENLLLPKKDYIHLGIAHYYIGIFLLNYLEYNTVMINLEKAIYYLSMCEDQTNMMAYCNLLRWQVLIRMGRLAFSEKYLSKALELIISINGKINFEMILFYHIIADTLLFVDDKHNILKYTKMANEIIIKYNVNPSAIKTNNHLISLIVIINQKENFNEMQEYFNNFLSCHQSVYEEESEMMTNLEIIFLAKGCYKEFIDLKK